MSQELFPEIIKLNKMLRILAKEYWLENVLYTLQWWLLIFMLIVPLIVLWKLIDRNRVGNVLLYGFIISLVSTSLDRIGVELMLWSYPYYILPVPHPLLDPINCALLPVTYTLIYQYFPKWKEFLIVLIVSALITSFLLEPLFVKISLYVLINWEHYYSLPMYIFFGVLVKYFVDRASLAK